MLKKACLKYCAIYSMTNFILRMRVNNQPPPQMQFDVLKTVGSSEYQF